LFREKCYAAVALVIEEHLRASRTIIAGTMKSNLLSSRELMSACISCTIA
jgi:hypothetical protein